MVCETVGSDLYSKCSALTETQRSETLLESRSREAYILPGHQHGQVKTRLGTQTAAQSADFDRVEVEPSRQANRGRR